MSDEEFVPTPLDWWQTADPRRLREANRAIAQRRGQIRKRQVPEQAQEQRRDIHGGE